MSISHPTTPVIFFDSLRAANAFAVHQALLKAERADPTLQDNPAWTVLRQDAYANFELAFEGRL